MQQREDDVATALLRRCGSVKTVWVLRCSSAGAASGRRGRGVKVAWGLCGGGVTRRVRAALALVAAVWGLRRSGLDALVLVLVQVLGYVLVEALVCVPVEQHIKHVKQP